MTYYFILYKLNHCFLCVHCGTQLNKLALAIATVPLKEKKKKKKKEEEKNHYFIFPATSVPKASRFRTTKY